MVAAVEETENGVKLTLSPAMADPSESTVITELNDVVIPQPECGCDHRRCPLVCRRKSNDILCHFPVRNGKQNFLVLVQLEPFQSGFQEKGHVLVSPEADCVPLLVFDTGPSSTVQYIVPCLNINSDQHYLYFEQLILNRDNIFNSTLMSNSHISSRYLPIDSGNVSPLLYEDSAETDMTCSPARNIFVKTGSRVIVYRLFSHSNAVFHTPDTEITNCSNTESFTHFEPDFLRIECSPTDIVLYSPCNSERVVKRYDTTVNASVFQCPDADLNVYHYQGNLSVGPYGSSIDIKAGDVIVLPFNDTSNAQCVGDLHSPMLFLSRSNGETYFVELSSGELHYIAANTCSPHSCLDMSVLKTSSGVIVGLFDHSNNTYLVLNLSCPSSPVLSRTFYPNPPVTFTLFLGTDTQPCPVCNVKPPNTTQQPSDEITSKPNEPSISVNRPDEPELAANGPDSNFIGATGGGVAVLLFAVILVFLAVGLAVTQ